MPLDFAALQRQLRPEWGREDRCSLADVDVLVVPSLSLEPSALALVTGAHHYEERQLFALSRLRDPGVRMVYVTSKLLPELVVDAVLELLPGVPAAHARRRLQLFDTDDASDRPLSAKLLERPALLARLREQLRPGRSFMLTYNVTPLEKLLSEKLQIPLFGTDPALQWWGTKAGARDLFQRLAIPHPPGSALVHDLASLAEATADLWERLPSLRRCVVKLNEGFSGEGNALLPLEPLDLAEHCPRERRRVLLEALQELPMPAAHWIEQMAQQGALVEAWLEGGLEVRSPSMQGAILPEGEVVVLSTHEQVLGGATGQTYLGCEFPAHREYRRALMDHGRAVGRELGKQGALERYSVDFLARQGPGGWDLQAIEVNLRQGGTTHPFMALHALTTGELDGESGLYRAPTGDGLYYLATDNFCDPSLRGLLPFDLVDIVADAGLHYDQARLQGTVFHLLGCLSQYGKIGMTSIGRSRGQARTVYEATQAQLIKGAQLRHDIDLNGSTIAHALPTR